MCWALPLPTFAFTLPVRPPPCSITSRRAAAAGGDTQRPLYFLFAAGIVNVVLNLVFVIKFQMDVAGVALATVISQCISAALVIRCLMKETGPLRLDLRQLKIYPMKLKQIMQVGIPAGIQGILFSLANVTVQSSINSFDDTTLVAASSAASSIENFVYANVNAFYQANTALYQPELRRRELSPHSADSAHRRGYRHHQHVPFGLPRHFVRASASGYLLPQ